MKSRNTQKIKLLNGITWLLIVDIFIFLISMKFYFAYNVLDPLIIPVKNYTSNISSNVGNFFITLENLNNVSKQNIILQDKIYLYKSKINSLENNKSKTLSISNQLKGNYLNNKYKYIYSQIMYYGTNNTFGYTYLNSGSAQGVKLNDPVVFENYLVGVVSKVFNNYSKVMLISNLNINVPVLINNTNGILKGSLSSSLTVQDITQLNNISLGNVVITSGLDGTFPKNLIVGNVEQVKGSKSGLFKDISVAPAININNLKYLFILKYE
jgi:rod shape-determining protein MreC